MKKILFFFFIFLSCASAFFILGFMIASLPPHIPAAPVSASFVYSFNSPGILNEAGSMDTSSSPYFWLDSGGQLIIENDMGETMQGAAPTTNKWEALYAANNALDTDSGLHPQNLFRLVTRSLWNNVSESVQFNIAADNFSASPNHNASNGLLLMNRYAADGQTLYYAGVRVDGTAVIKKKIHGVYYTMAQGKVFPGTYAGYVADTNLIPHDAWITLRSDTVTNVDGSVTVTLYMELPGETAWRQLLQATDKGQYGGTAPILGPGYQGIRTDFMDVKFKQFRLMAL